MMLTCANAQNLNVNFDWSAFAGVAFVSELCKGYLARNFVGTRCV